MSWVGSMQELGLYHDRVFKHVPIRDKCTNIFGEYVEKELCSSRIN